MNEITANLNWLAVGVGTILSYILGALWYSPKMFGKKWAEGVGLDIEGPEKPPVAAMVIQLVGTFLLSWVIGLMATTHALYSAILIVVTIIFLLVANGLFAMKSTYSVCVEGGFIAAIATIMIICQGVL